MGSAQRQISAVHGENQLWNGAPIGIKLRTRISLKYRFNFELYQLQLLPIGSVRSLYSDGDMSALVTEHDAL